MRSAECGIANASATNAGVTPDLPAAPVVCVAAAYHLPPVNVASSTRGQNPVKAGWIVHRLFNTHCGAIAHHRFSEIEPSATR